MSLSYTVTNVSVISLAHCLFYGFFFTCVKYVPREIDPGLLPLVIVDPLIVSSYPPFSLIPRHVRNDEVDIT